MNLSALFVFTLLTRDVSMYVLPARCTRWLRDSLLNLFEDYSTLTCMRVKSGNMAQNRDVDTDMDKDRDSAVGDEATAEPTSPMTSKTRWSISDLEETLREMLVDTPATRESDTDDSEVELPSFDSCARYTPYQSYMRHASSSPPLNNMEDSRWWKGGGDGAINHH